MRILLLGGTTEAGMMAATLAEARLDAVYSYAGRTDNPVRQPLPQRTGGFGGIAGLVSYLQGEAITHIIDATHPFAAEMSRNAIAACAITGTALIALERKPWSPQPGDKWQAVPDIDACLAALPHAATRIFAAIGRQNLAAFAAHPQHHYLLRLVDAPATLPLPNAEAVIARGPFTLESDLDLLKSQRIQLIIAKNSGGTGARAKLDAARLLGLPVIMIDRPKIPPRQSVESVAEVLDWLGHPALRGV
ncbi:MAG: cobalt-precorrin-6A reductase [Paracoccaceae bacterium]